MLEEAPGVREPHLRAGVPPARLRHVEADVGEEDRLHEALDRLRARLAPTGSGAGPSLG